jgi:hypothetical protein
MIEPALMEPAITARSRQGAITRPSLEWLADIICHLRDDLADEQAARGLPSDTAILAWVREAYYPGLLELAWEESVLSLLHRLQRSRIDRHRAQKIEFASLALIQLRRATHSSPIWDCSEYGIAP